MAEAPLKLENRTKNCETLRAVDAVSLEMQPGEVFGLLGPNGAGKSSIISILTTLERPSSDRAGACSQSSWISMNLQ